MTISGVAIGKKIKRLVALLPRNLYRPRANADIWSATGVLPIVESEALPINISLTRIIKGKGHGVADWDEKIN
jgi:hypothetical protein